jgi:toxin ParE1/3/4
MSTEGEWKVINSHRADQDLDEIVDYIKNVLLEPEIADRQVARIKKAIESLSFMPYRYHLHYDERLRAKGVRVLTVDNYVIWYVPDEKQKCVKITHVIHNKRNIDNVLNEPEQ